MQPNGTLLSIEWLMEYYFNWKLDGEGGYDMGKISYLMWNNNTSAWSTLNSDGHHFHKNNAGDDTEYVGHLTTQLYYIKIETNPSYYINDSGIVKTAISFEDTETNEFTDEYTQKDCELVTAYNGIILSD